MAITNTWSIQDMQRLTQTGMYFSCTGQRYRQAMEPHRTLLQKAASSAWKETRHLQILSLTLTLLKPMCLVGYTQVWLKVKKRLMKLRARIEADRDAKVQKQIDAAATTASGVPWASDARSIITGETTWQQYGKLAKWNERWMTTGLSLLTGEIIHNNLKT